MTDEEAHNAFLTHTQVKVTWSPMPGQIIMIGYRRDGKSIITAVEDDRGQVRVAAPDELELCDPREWDPRGPKQ